MEILKNTTPKIENAVLILGFFDGIHLGHRAVLNKAVNYAKEHDSKTIILTLDISPNEYFNKANKYIFQRNYNYELIANLGIDYLIEQQFNLIANITAGTYLKDIIDKYNPIAIFTGYNHTFGLKREGTPEFLKQHSKIYNYEYYCIPEIAYGDTIISSTGIKSLLKKGELTLASKFLDGYFAINSQVIKGNQIGRTIGFPTANMLYPQNIVKIPHGVYKVTTTNNMPALLNWGIKPTINGTKELLEVHIPNFSGDLYGQDLRINIIQKIRNECKFNNLQELRIQIEKDLKECLES